MLFEERKLDIMNTQTIIFILYIHLYNLLLFTSSVVFAAGLYQTIKGIQKDDQTREKQGQILLYPSSIVLIVSLLCLDPYDIAIAVGRIRL